MNHYITPQSDAFEESGHRAMYRGWFNLLITRYQYS